MKNPSYTISPDQFKILKIDSEEYKKVSYNRRDYYKIAFVTSGTGIMHFGQNSVSINGPYLIFFSPLLSYAWEPTSEEHSGYNCLFTKDFLAGKLEQNNLSKSELFKIGAIPAFKIDDSNYNDLEYLFQKMYSEFNSSYKYKEEMMVNYINLILHSGTRLLNLEDKNLQHNASERICANFFELLQKQFPIADSNDRIALKSPNDFADKLNIHVNYLNQALQLNSGKNTNWHIQQKIIMEAKMLLKNTDWSVAEIGYALGFENPPYFNNYFKKHTEMTPLSYRK